MELGDASGTSLVVPAGEVVVLRPPCVLMHYNFKLGMPMKMELDLLIIHLN